LALRGQLLRCPEPQSRCDDVAPSVFALYNRNRKLIKILGTLFGLQQLGSAASTVVTMPRVLFGEDGCHPLAVPVPVVRLACVRIPLHL
jgi:hypothetical protein